jgi:hypothetical protein
MELQYNFLSLFEKIKNGNGKKKKAFYISTTKRERNNIENKNNNNNACVKKFPLSLSTLRNDEQRECIIIIHTYNIIYVLHNIFHPLLLPKETRSERERGKFCACHCACLPGSLNHKIIIKIQKITTTITTMKKKISLASKKATKKKFVSKK